MNIDEQKKGLYGKFIVRRTDNSPKHSDCQYFVLDANHDPFAAVALRTYAHACRLKYPNLAEDLIELAKFSDKRNGR